VFDRFYRGQYAREQAIPGMGLGLGIARNVITAQGGALTLASSTSGTAAQVTLPTLT
jgi:signal transduction histidine kinase